ncbi:DUF131 domain-containing protein [Metallosphaera tengchongensis]|uniref:DUF131 domain-containing protein n=1 Tax=Metallosphaera tengchongensis TaxID=1532350 RepID=A0A6N0NUD7_9CREN|nr:DUF131 domain-containing protein [Metallosphaera tengchongensis]QKQ99774.1 DUF131 domain-containing protein [Metallosphaera tengchongensis]
MRLTLVGIALIFLGFILTFIGAFTSTSFSTSPAVGGVVLIGPFPIIFGKGYSGEVIPLIIIGLIFTVISVIFFLSSIWFIRKAGKE